MCRLDLDTKTGSKGSLGGGVVGGIALGVVSLKHVLCIHLNCSRIRGPSCLLFSVHVLLVKTLLLQ